MAPSIIGLVCLGISGLDYLHNWCNPPIIHRDLNTPNILLDENMASSSDEFRRETIHILRWVTPIIDSGDKQNHYPRLKGSFKVCSAWKQVEIAMSCVPSTAAQRPDISKVLDKINEC
ncbi:hypothetical protein SAY87_003840 [Trapa incisa]|uniref:Protein kinase domain-containing protein n=1 Tax=Trapa incisa TaxID=236973 RepID=A0AAN7KJS8_9MYRT|nr:hypothetical protein SAY87_003840 [Trapa incisa]